jgi:hypothetical protein
MGADQKAMRPWLSALASFKRWSGRGSPRFNAHPSEEEIFDSLPIQLIGGMGQQCAASEWECPLLAREPPGGDRRASGEATGLAFRRW